VGIGDTLAEARRQAGLTVSQVSQRTCIRETIIRGIERGDYSACGGDFYARGHIRSIARAVGADPEPLIREYDATQGAPQAISAADVFEPATPIKIRERRRPNWTAALAVILVAAIGFGVYHLVSSSGRPSGHSPPAAHHATTDSRGKAKPSHHSSQGTRAVSHQHSPSYAHVVVISLTASANCWVELTSASGKIIYEGVAYPGTTLHWREHQAVTLRLGNPGGVTLTVDGKSRPAGSNNQPVTLSLGPGRQAPG